MLGCKASSTPIEFGNKDRMFKGEPVNKTMYQQLVGKLIYLSHMRPDIAFAVSLVSQIKTPRCSLQDIEIFETSTRQGLTLQEFRRQDNTSIYR
ncbi:hypothetical protein LIER_36386 [Lithospermum erythrorhizon]|uniref:Reverse transcriptase n=1 Tax=Lithospermum erythrorhizon TaxID=34254 RepID=A0AAV3P6I6_LITER